MNMNSAAQLFANFLDEVKHPYEVRDEKVITTKMPGENLSLIPLAFVFGDDGSNVSINAVSLAKIPQEKLPKVYELCNRLNVRWRWVKFYVDSDNEIMVRDDAVIEPSTTAVECAELMVRMTDIVDKAYPDIMAAIWGNGSGVSAPNKR